MVLTLQLRWARCVWAWWMWPRLVSPHQSLDDIEFQRFKFFLGTGAGLTAPEREGSILRRKTNHFLSSLTAGLLLTLARCGEPEGPPRLRPPLGLPQSTPVSQEVTRVMVTLTAVDLSASGTSKSRFIPH